MQQTTGNVITPPHSLEAEHGVLGALLIGTAGTAAMEQVFRILKPEDFYRPAHQRMFRGMVSMNDIGKPIDLVMLTEHFESTGQLEGIGGFSYPAEIAKNTPGTANIIPYAKAVKERARHRGLINTLYSCLESVQNASSKKAEHHINDVFGMLESFTESQTDAKHGELVTMSDAVTKVLDSIDRRLRGESLGITTGIDSLDKILEPEGVVKHALCVIGARPKMGKTSTIMKILEHISINLNKTAIIFSMEMSDEEIAMKSLTQHSKVSKSEMCDRRGMSDENWAKVTSSIATIGTDKILISDKSGQTLRDIVYHAKKVKRERGEIGAIFIDYLTMMEAEKAERNDLAYGKITKGLKALAKEIKTPVFLLTQLNRDLEKRPDKRPVPSDSRDTGQIEQDCDYWIGLYRDEVYHEDTPGKGVIEMIVRLNRHGGTGTALAQFDQGRVYNLPDTHVYRTHDDEQSDIAAARKERSGYKKF